MNLEKQASMHRTIKRYADEGKVSPFADPTNEYLRRLALRGAADFVRSLPSAERTEVEQEVSHTERDTKHLEAKLASSIAEYHVILERPVPHSKDKAEKLEHHRRVLEGEIVLFADIYQQVTGRLYDFSPKTRCHFKHPNNGYGFKG